MLEFLFRRPRKIPSVQVGWNTPFFVHVSTQIKLCSQPGTICAGIVCTDPGVPGSVDRKYMCTSPRTFMVVTPLTPSTVPPGPLLMMYFSYCAFRHVSVAPVSKMPAPIRFGFGFANVGFWM